MKQKNRKKQLEPYLLILPGLLIFTVFFVIPVMTTFVYSFTNYDGFQPKLNFVGWKNYINIFTNDKKFWASIVNNIKLVLCYNTIGLFISVSLALVLNKIRFKNFYRACFFIPVVMSTVAIGYTWSFMFDPTNGIFSGISKLLGLPVVDFLGNYKLALYAVIFVDIWKGQGNNMIILLAGLQSIPADVYESARIDGATTWQQIRYITLPLLRPMIGTISVMAANYGLLLYNEIALITSGGPDNADDFRCNIADDDRLHQGL